MKIFLINADNFGHLLRLISMKNKILIFFITLLLLFSCSNKELVIENLLLDKNKSGAVIVDYGLEDNETFVIKFSERVEIKEVVFNTAVEKKSLVGDSITISLPYTLDMGEKFTLALTYTKNGGNTTRAFFTLYGRNSNKAGLLLNKVSVDGNKANPDRIELLVTKSGNIGGMAVTDDITSSGVVLPSLTVKRGDLIVIYWDSRSGKENFLRDYEKELYTYYINGGMESTLISTTGGIVVYDEVGGTIIDAIVYSNFTEASTKKEAFIALVELLEEEGEWEGEAVSSQEITASRLLMRLPGGIDRNTADDWFTSTAGVKFGYEHTYTPYSPE